MDANRLSQGLGWVSVGLGLAELTFSERICQGLALRGRTGLVRARGVRQVLAGVGLLTQRDARPWLWARLAGDAVDLCLLGATLRRPGAAFVWRVAVAVGAAGITLVDALAVRRLRAKRLPDVIGMELSRTPMESWRGSGLAEDVGVRQREADAQVNAAERERRMREAQERLGLPDPDSQGPHGG